MNDARDESDDGGTEASKLRMQQFRRGNPRLEHFDPQMLIERADFDAEAAGEARAHAFVETLEIARRAIRSDDDLPTRIDQAR